MLSYDFNYEFTDEKRELYFVYICPGDREFTRIFLGPSSQAKLRVIWVLALVFEAVYPTNKNNNLKNR